jgi:ABC-type transport system involved in multi-copper enzyme maturation permease subunit
MTGRWRDQMAAVLRLELRKSLLGRRAALIWLLSAVPVAFCALMAVVSLFDAPTEMQKPSTAAMIYAIFYRLILVLTYLGCVWTFMNLFRGEVVDRSLHYYFLAPVRREVLVAGKYLAGWISTTVVFVAGTLLSIGALYSYFGLAQAAEYLLRGRGLGQVLAYAGITTLACLGYGAIFLVLGLFLRNPLIPAVAIFVWEGLNPFLPPLLKKLSVIFYLHGMLPVALDAGPFAVLAEPTPVWLAIPGLIVFSGAILIVAGLRIRRMEIAYGAD